MTSYRYTNKKSAEVHTVESGESASMRRQKLGDAIMATKKVPEGKIFSKITVEHTDDGNWIESVYDSRKGGWVPTGRAVNATIYWATPTPRIARESHDSGSRAAGRYFARGGMRGW